jgi:hypothetical protein
VPLPTWFLVWSLRVANWLLLRLLIWKMCMPIQIFLGQLNQVLEYQEGLNVGYRFFCSSNAPVLFLFGHGLSFSRLEYNNLSAVVEQDEKHDKKVTL